MTRVYRRTLFWTPRLLAISYIVFLSMFALDVFGEEHGFWQILFALLMHLIPSFVLIVGLVLAWQWEWIGAALYAAAGMLYIAQVVPRSLTLATKITWILTIAGPTFLIAALFLANWLKHNELRPPP